MFMFFIEVRENIECALLTRATLC